MFSGIRDVEPYEALHEADEPPFEPEHVHVYEPLAVVTELCAPEEQRPMLGAPVYVPPLDEPQAPLLDVAVCDWPVTDDCWDCSWANWFCNILTWSIRDWIVCCIVAVDC